MTELKRHLVANGVPTARAGGGGVPRKGTHGTALCQRGLKRSPSLLNPSMLILVASCVPREPIL